MADSAQTDLLVLGAGPGGYAAAFLAADKGMKVTMVDARDKPGGSCLHVGCIPSKALLHAAKVIIDAKDAQAIGLHYEAPKIDVATLRTHTFKTVDTMANNLLELCKRRKVEYIHARGTFVDSHTLALDNGEKRQFEHAIVATGSSPTKLPGLDLASPRVIDSTGALKLEDVPRSLLVVGGGYIGLEMGCVYASLGSRVTVVELTGSLLPGLDVDLIRPLQKRLTPMFEKIYLNTKVTKLAETQKGISALLEGEEVTDKEPVFDRVLVAVGRRPNSKGFGLENTRAKIDDRGFIQINDQRRTADEAIFAIGDVAGEPMLAHKASHEGKLAVEVIAGENAAWDVRAIPAVVFTDPEVAWCGLMENDAKKQKKEVKVERFPWAASGRAMTLGRTEGLTKLVLDPETERVLGVGIVGPGAGEMIAEGVLAVEMSASARDLSLIIHAHPTLSETVGEAADMLYGTATDIYRPKK
jgi:dihydrolipoamide dehydrogenase